LRTRPPRRLRKDDPRANAPQASPQASEAVPASFDPRSLRLIFPALVLVLLLASLDQTIVSTALPTIAGEFHGLEHLSWIVTAYLLATTIVSPVYGKLGDLYGRKIVLQAAIVLFLIGSALCGLSRNMGELIAFRAIQGLGGGGLIVTTMAAVGDVIPPRERGRYQGFFGAVFGVSTVIGPLIGGFFVQHLSWHWIFYVNLPLGLLAVAVLAWAFPSRTGARGGAIDYPGAIALAGTLTGIVLLTSLGGSTLPWDSAGTIGLAVLSVSGLAAFLFVESRAEEPVLPLGLFRNRIFTVCAAVGFVVGLAMFGSVTYLPLYLQVVKGVDPATAGLEVTPMMAGLLASSITSGQIISRAGRYKIFPIAGTAVMSLGLFLLSTLGVETPTLVASSYMLVLGLGLGMVMQVLVLAVQNAVPYSVLGVATSSVTLFRSVGAAVGVSLFGALFASGLASRLAGLPGTGAGGAMPAYTNPAAIKALPEAVRGPYLEAFAGALQPVFLGAAVLGALAFLLTFLLREIPLRTTARTESMGEVFAMPHDATSLEELERIVTRLADREKRWRVYEELAREFGVNLRPDELWLLGRIGDLDRELSRDALLAAERANPEAIRRGLCALAQAGYLSLGEGGPPHLTERGKKLRERMVESRRGKFAKLVASWAPEEHAEARAMLARLARSFIAQPPVP
jgi:EmrB/QacA subfamily drug resistance transporter